MKITKQDLETMIHNRQRLALEKLKQALECTKGNAVSLTDERYAAIQHTESALKLLAELNLSIKLYQAFKD